VNVNVTRTRAAIGTQLSDFFKAADLPWGFTTRLGLPAYDVEGDALTLGQAADRYLPGGFDGSYGGSGHRHPLYRVGQVVRVNLEYVRRLPVGVLAIRGARYAEDGYVALVQDATGGLHVVPA